MTAYKHFVATLTAAQADPTPFKAKAPASTDVTRWSWDPLRSEMVAYIATLAARHQHYAGTPLGVYPRVEKVSLQAKPWPTVVISDCAVGDGWHLYSKAGARLPEIQATPPGPRRITITMIKYKGRWGASKQTSDMNGSPCTP